MLFGKILEMSLLSCYVIAVVCIIRFLLNKCERKYSFYLWFVVFLNLILPVSLHGPFSLIPKALTESVELQAEYLSETAHEANIQIPGTGVTASNALEDTTTDSTNPNKEQQHWEIVGNIKNSDNPQIDVEVVNWQVGADGQVVVEQSQLEGSKEPDYRLQSSPEQMRLQTMSDEINQLGTIVSCLWLLGIGILWSISLVKGIILSKTLGKCQQENEISEEGVIFAEDISTPFLWGIFKPIIYLPVNVEAEERIYIIAHESYHRKRFDHITKLAVFVIVTLHWFNPMVWLAYALFVRDMEISCDEAVLWHMGKDIKKQYAASLLKYAARQNGFVLAPLTFGEPSLKSRIQNVLKYRKRGIPVTAMAILVMSLTACGLVMRPSSEETTNEWEQENIEQQEVVPTLAPKSTPEPSNTAMPETTKAPTDTVVIPNPQVCPLKPEEVKWFNESFFNMGYFKEGTTEIENICNQFLTHEYAKPEDIDISEIFYNGAGENMTEDDWLCMSGKARHKLPLYTGNMILVSEEEHAAIADIGVDVSKVSRKVMEDIMQMYTGLTLEKSNCYGMEQLLYNKRDDVYYHVHGDTNAICVNIIRGHYNEDGTITLYYAYDVPLSSVEETEAEYMVVLRPTENGYHFVSNRRLENSRLSEVVQEELNLSTYP